MRSRPPVVALQVGRVALDRLDGIVQRVSECFLSQVGEATVRIVDGIVAVQLDRFRVQGDGFFVVFI